MTSDTGARLADVNGDGLVDIVWGDGIGQYEIRRVYINKGDGTGWEEDSGWVLPVAFGPTWDTGARIIDINGDGLPDIVYGTYNSQTRKIYLNTGSGWEEDSTWAIPEPFVFAGGYDFGVRLFDVNGDGLLDLVRSSADREGNNGYKKVYINTGHSWEYDENWEVPEYFIYGTFQLGLESVDVNGDGLDDLIFAPYNQSLRKIYINTGKSWQEDNNWTIQFSFYDGGFDMGTRVADVNGDGLVDVLYGPSNASLRKVYIADPKNADMLEQATNSRGGENDITYKGSPQYTDGSGDLLNPNLPILTQTVSQITYDDGLGHNWSENYEYADGTYYFSDYLNRKFAGFGQVVKTDAEGNVTKTYFHQGNDSDSSHGEYSDDYYKIGKPYRTEVHDDSDNLYSKSINKWESYDLGDDNAFVKLTQTISSAYDGDTTHKDKAETYAYDDDSGNLTQKISWGEVSGSDDGTFTDTGSDKYTTDIDYAATTGSAVIGLPSEEITIDQSSDTVKDTKYYYDTLTLGNVDEGNLTKQEMWTDNANYINIQKTYNAYGLVTQELDPNGNETDYAYDTYNLYPETVTNALSQETTYEYDYSLGKPSQLTDPNGRVFQTIYDALDRVSLEKQPDLANPTTLVTKTSYAYTDTSAPTSVLQTNYLDSSNSFDVYTYLDGFGRKIQERKEAETSGQFSAKDFAYNDLGLLEKESLPYFSAGSARATATSNSDLYTTYTYDPLQRVVTATNAVGTTTNTYDDWKLSIIDAKNNAKDLYKDAYDNLIQVDEHNDSSTYSTYYDWNGLGNLIKITDSQENVRNFTYDGLGRRLSAEDLHDPADETFGTWWYEYDDAGNLTSRTDPKSQTVNFDYDDLNRVTSEDYLGQSGTEVAYVYDSGTDGLGRLYTATTADFETTYEYNPLGQIKTETKDIDSTEYETQFDYDRAGNQTLITYPSGDQVKYEYNGAGLLESVSQKPDGEANFTDIVSNYDYSPLEQVNLQEDANGAVTTNTYDESNLYRLLNKYTRVPYDGSDGADVNSWFGNDYEAEEVQLSMSSAKNDTNDESGDEYTNGVAMSAIKKAVEPLFNNFQAALSDPSQSPAVMVSTAEPPAGSMPALPDNAPRDMFGRPILQISDKTIYLKAEKLDKPAALPKEAVDAFDKASKDFGQQLELKSYLPKEAILQQEQQQEQENMLLSGNAPTAPTNLETRDLWLTQNLLSNSGFEDGLNNWQWQNDLDATQTQDCATSHFGSCSEKVTINTAGSAWQVQLYQTLRLDQNTNYKLRFWAKADSAAAVTFEVSQNHSPYNNLGLWKGEFGLTTAWQAYEFDFTTLSTDDNAKLAFELGAHSGDFWFDDIQLVVDNFNSIKNNSFENHLASWDFMSYGQGQGAGTLSEYGGTVPEGNVGAQIDVSNPGDPWQVSLAQAIGSVSDSESYIVTFYARSSGQPRLAKVALAQNSSPWSDLTSETEFETSSNDWQKYQVEFTPSADEANSRLIFYVAQDSTTIYFDDIHVYQTQPTRFDSQPYFSAIYHDADSGDYADNYQIQMIKYDGDWDSPLWDSGKTALTTSVLEGDRSEDISYGGTSLPQDGMKYLWRIKFWDDDDNEGDWSNGNDFFIMNGKRLQDLSYEYDDVGNITQIIDESETNTRKKSEFEYDDLYRLTSATITDSATGTDYTHNYTYDSLGNITSFPGMGTYEYEGNTGSNYANPHAFTSVSGTNNANINYDNNGNIISEVLMPYNWIIFQATWDYNNRLASTGGWQTPATYSYDHAGQRIKQNIDSGSIVTIYPNKYYNVETQGEDTKVTEHIFGNGEPVAVAEIKDSTLTLYYIHGDHLNSSSIMTKSNGDIEQALDYYPYGGIRFNEQQTENPLDEQRKHTGHEYDTNSSLTYMGARYYAGTAGRFLSEDPVFLVVGDAIASKIWSKNLIDPQNLNSYSYARNNPLSYIDPLGLYNTKTGVVESGDTPDSIVNSINSTFNINTDWATVQEVSFYHERFQDKTLDQIVGESLRIGTDMTTDITDRLNSLNQARSIAANLMGNPLLLFAPNCPWDIKNSSDPILGGGKNRTYYSYIYNGGLIRYDAPGNINYGYVARSLGLDSGTIKMGASMEQFGSNLFGDMSFSDNSGDANYVQIGIDSYNTTPWWEKLLIHYIF
ncbi:MAG: carbohydrate binding domain-containing protein [Patescibacteria group bacterium]|nr:carbohydrate binding domain-containing protein [Patescibacteria group bacterium]